MFVADPVKEGLPDSSAFPMQIPLSLHCNSRSFLQGSCVQARYHHWCQSWGDLCSAVVAAQPCSVAFVGLASFVVAFDSASLALPNEILKHYNRAVFNKCQKLFCECFCFALLCFVIFDQSEVKRKPINCDYFTC